MLEIINYFLFFLCITLLFYIKKWLYYLLFKVNDFFEKRTERNSGAKSLNILGLIVSVLLHVILLLSSIIISLSLVDEFELSDIKNVYFLTALLDFLSTHVATKIARKKTKVNEYYF